MNKLAAMAAETGRLLDDDYYQQEAALLHATVDEATFDKIADYEEHIRNDPEIQQAQLPKITMLKMAEQLVMEEALQANPEYAEQVKQAAALGEQAADQVMQNLQ